MILSEREWALEDKKWSLILPYTIGSQFWINGQQYRETARRKRPWSQELCELSGMPPSRESHKLDMENDPLGHGVHLPDQCKIIPYSVFPRSLWSISRAKCFGQDPDLICVDIYLESLWLGVQRGSAFHGSSLTPACSFENASFWHLIWLYTLVTEIRTWFRVCRLCIHLSSCTEKKPRKG